VPRETLPGERRVALVPDVAKKLVDSGLEVGIESGAGVAAGFPDQAYRDAGAEVVAGPGSVLGNADAVLKVQAPTLEELRLLKSRSVLISFLQPATQAAVVEGLAQQGVTAFSLELLPRISRAQSMDALSSQASLAGYKAVLMAANRLGKFFPMLMTAAGTIAPARVLVLGAGVAGLQAIATARRLGAVVEAYDVRPAVKEEVQSLGATFVELGLEAQEGQGGYAREQSDEFLQRQRELLGERIAAADVVITTAAIPGRRAPVLVTGEMVRGMRPGSVIVDLAADTGGNCELTRPGEVIEVGGVILDGTLNVPSTVPLHASQLYSRNVANLLQHLLKDGRIHIDFQDEITRGCCVTYQGEIVHERARELIKAAS
jgi:H+-translocating NAD(P) transhydrogenase subunit alpha